MTTSETHSNGRNLLPQTTTMLLLLLLLLLLILHDHLQATTAERTNEPNRLPFLPSDESRPKEEDDILPFLLLIPDFQILPFLQNLRHHVLYLNYEPIAIERFPRLLTTTNRHLRNNPSDRYENPMIYLA
jgi:hypothetical protein